MSILRTVAGKVGSAIDKLPGTGGQSLFNNKWIDVSSTLQNYGGNVAGSLKDAIVKPAYASDGFTPAPAPYSSINYSPVNYNNTPNPYTQPSGGGGGGDVLGMTDPNGGGGGGGDRGPSELDVINSEYNAFNQTLSEQEGIANQRFSQYEGQVTGERDRSLQQIADQKSSKNVELDNTAEQGRKTTRVNLQTIRQLLADLEQRNAAQSAIGGGGSMNEALADRFGRTAQQSVGNALSEGQRFQNDLELERTRTNQFFEQKKTEVGDWARNKIDEGKLALQENLAAIAASRRESAAAKQRATLDAWRGFYDNVNQVKLQAANFMAQYSAWKQGQDAKIANVLNFQVQAPNGMNFQPAIGAVNDALTTRGVSSTAQAYNNAPLRVTNPTTTEDEENPYLPRQTA